MWLYENRVIKTLENIPEGTHGFIYETLHKPSGKKYIGKKALRHYLNKKIGKRERAKLQEERREKGMRGRAPLKKKVVKESDWLDYYGSSKEIKELVETSSPEDFERRILMFVSSKKLLTYYETKLLFEKKVLEGDSGNYLNDNILGKFYRKDFLEEE